MNQISLIGNLTSDPELTQTPNGVSVCKFSLAVSRNFSNSNGEKITDFFNCTAWRQTGEHIAKYCKKGNKVGLTGSVQMNSYEDSNGNKRTSVTVVVQTIEFLKTASQNADGENEGDDEGEYTAPSKSSKNSYQRSGGGRSSSVEARRALQAFEDDDEEAPF